MNLTIKKYSQISSTIIVHKYLRQFHSANPLSRIILSGLISHIIIAPLVLVIGT